VGSQLVACPSCSCHFEGYERRCPHCAAEVLQPSSGARAHGAIALGLSLTVVGASGCGEVTSGGGGAGGDAPADGGFGQYGGMGYGGSPSSYGGSPSYDDVGGSAPTCGDRLACDLLASCAAADLSACTCEGCSDVCEYGSDCVCPSCAADAQCSARRCSDDCLCDPFFEGCLCSDCLQHPMCL